MSDERRQWNDTGQYIVMLRYAEDLAAYDAT